MTKSKYKKHKKYFVKNYNEISVVDYGYFDAIDTWPMALAIGVSCFGEMQRTLTEDAKDGKDSYIGTMKVTTGLDRTLQELNHRHPGLLKEIHTAKLRTNGISVSRC